MLPTMVFQSTTASFGKCRSGTNKVQASRQHLFHVHLILRAGFDLIELSGTGGRVRRCESKGGKFRVCFASIGVKARALERYRALRLAQNLTNEGKKALDLRDSNGHSRYPLAKGYGRPNEVFQTITARHRETLSFGVRKTRAPPSALTPRAFEVTRLSRGKHAEKRLRQPRMEIT